MPAPEDTKPSCPDCDTEMDSGWLHERGEAKAINTLRLYWEAGDAQKYWLGGYQSTGKDFLVTAWRCPQCGLLRHYANE